jgi:uncharacterized protein (TIGR00730 family)
MERKEGPLITVFGSSRAIEGEPDYGVGVSLGRHLALRGFQICTGGYGGLMEAVSRGASASGASPIGITFRAFGDECNPYVGEHVPMPDLFARLSHLVLESDGFVVMRGGMGTIAELMLAWVHIESGLKQLTPIVLLGDCWESFLSNLYAAFTFSEGDLSLVKIALTPEEAVSLLEPLLETSNHQT